MAACQPDLALLTLTSADPDPSSHAVKQRRRGFDAPIEMEQALFRSSPGCLGQPITPAALKNRAVSLQTPGKGVALIGGDAELLGDLGDFDARAVGDCGEELLAALAARDSFRRPGAAQVFAARATAAFGGRFVVETQQGTPEGLGLLLELPQSGSDQLSGAIDRI